ncbi:MAG: hypothetical protein ACRC7R_09910 [Sarcina sp.]
MKKIISFFLTIFILIWSINCYLDGKKYLKYIRGDVCSSYDIDVNKICEYEINVQYFINEI